MSYKTVNQGTTFGVKFRSGFDMKLLHLQASHDRWTYNKLLETLKDEYKRYGRVNCSRGRIGRWYTEMRGEHPFLQQTVSRISRESLFALGHHYEQYVETERLKVADIKPEWEFGEPHFKRYGETISLPITITHDKTKGSARFDGHRTIRISKMGEIYLSREFPMLNYRPKVGTIYQTRDGKWRMGIVCDVEVEKPEPKEPKLAGVDRNVGNVATADMVLELPERVQEEMKKLEKNSKHWQRVMKRRQGPDHKARTPHSKRYEKARKTHAGHQRKLANIRKNTAYKTANVLCDADVTHAVFEKLPIQNMVKSAKGTKEKPGKNVAQKRGLSKAILNQGWGILAVILSYMLAGGIIRIDPAYTSQMCSSCLHVSKDSRCGRLFRCVRCGFIHHVDINARCNIENHGRKVLDLPRRFIKSLSTRVDTASGIGLQDVEGGFTTDQTVNFTVSQMANGGYSVKRQAWTEVEGVVSAGAHVVQLWNDV